MLEITVKAIVFIFISMFALFERVVETKRPRWYKIGNEANLTSEERHVYPNYLSGCATAQVLRELSEVLQQTPVQVPGDRTAGLDVVLRRVYLVGAVAAGSR